jgi:hypothetical protein
VSLGTPEERPESNLDPMRVVEGYIRPGLCPAGSATDSDAAGIAPACDVKDGANLKRRCSRIRKKNMADRDTQGSSHPAFDEKSKAITGALWSDSGRRAGSGVIQATRWAPCLADTC